MSTTIRVSQKTRTRLAKIGARLLLKDGKERSKEDIIWLLVKNYESTPTS